MEKWKTHEIVVLAVALFLSGLLILYNALTSPVLTEPVITVQSGSAASYDDLWEETAADSTESSASTASASGNQGESQAVKPSIVNINTATNAQLQTLPGIGPVKAQAIIDYRNHNGKFNTVEELLNVKGIGEKTLENLTPYVTVG